MNKLVKQQNSVGGLKIKLSELPKVNQTEALVFNAYMNEKKFKEYSTKEDLIVMTALITRWASFVGAKPLDATELNMLANFIKDSFPNFNKEDLNVSINMCVNGKLDVDENCYGALTPLYCSRILRAYEDFKFNTISKVKDEIKKTQVEKTIESTPEERVERMKQLLLDAREKALKDVYYDFGEIVYKFIKNNKLVTLTKQIIADSEMYAEKSLRNEKHKEAQIGVILNKSMSVIKDDIKKIKEKKHQYQREYVVNLWLKSNNVLPTTKNLNIQMIEP
jgi:hypothetical protein